MNRNNCPGRFKVFETRKKELERRHNEIFGQRAAKLRDLRTQFDSLSKNRKMQGKARAVAAEHKRLADQPVPGVTTIGMLF